MGELAELTQRHQKVEDALALIAKLKDTQAKSQDKIMDAFVELFNLLLKDSNDSGNIFHTLSSSFSLCDKQEVQRYVEHLQKLYNVINELDNDFPFKKSMQERFHDNFKVATLTAFKAQYESEPEKAVADFIEQNQVNSRVNTVEVISWGTKQAYGNGLKTQVDAKLNGDGVGHAALMMRIAADDKGLDLIKKYCLDEKGDIKIPYQIKKYHGQAVYEIYWSFWPGSLDTLKSDIEHERLFEAYKDPSLALNDVPQELSSKYLLFKNRKQKKTYLAPAQMRKLSPNIKGSDREQYIQLKQQKYALNETLASLDVLLKKYLKEDVKFSSKGITEAVKDKGHMAIEPGSNFLVLLHRFKAELGCLDIASNILLSKKISADDSEQLKLNIEQLIKETKVKKENVKEALKAQGSLVQNQRQKIKELKSKIKKNRALLKDKSSSTSSVSSELGVNLEALYQLYLPEKLSTSKLESKLALLE